MSSSGDFLEHINNVISSVRKRIGWICRTFYNRSVEFMRRIYISLVRPTLDYCSQIWGPPEGPLLDKLEKTQKDFTRLIPELRNMCYEDCLNVMNLQSIQRRFDRYRLIYMKKVQLGLVPNPGVTVESGYKARNGFKYMIPARNSRTKKVDLRTKETLISIQRPQNI